MAGNCPHCKDRSLAHSRIEADLPTLSCDGCGGSLLSLVTCRHWRKNTLQEAPEGASGDSGDASDGIDDTIGGERDPVEVEDSSIALCCPKCRRFMSKFRLSADARNQIDLCVHCDEAWLDRGEWQLLDRLALAGKLPQVFTQPWQNRVRNAEAERRSEQRWKERLGADYERAQITREWLRSHPEARTLLAFLNQVREEIPL